MKFKPVFFVITSAVGLILALTGKTSAAVALLSGILTNVFIGNSFQSETKKLSKTLLSLSIVGLGAGLNFYHFFNLGLKGIFFSLFTVALTFLVGAGLNKIFNLEWRLLTLLNSGTAICGGSAIAAVSPLVKSKESEISLSLAIIFVLNGIALFLFPWLGQLLKMSELQFGFWSALAIHDTSSVVGAASQYGTEALKIATAAKLIRALWIIPMSFAIALIMKKKNQENESKVNASVPLFLYGFVATSLLFTFIPSISDYGESMSFIAKGLLVFSLYLIGTNVSLGKLLTYGYRPIAYAIALWFFMATLDLVLVMNIL